MTKKVQIITTDINNPWINLALEEHYLVNQSKGGATLFLWQNKETVVIGRNQNPWTECNLALMAEDDIRLARRITGGGAVFHDMGNLNFSFIMSRSIYNVDRQCDVIIKALESLGIKAEKSGRNDIIVEGKKFSGNAFCFRENNALHHGTILIGADKEKMSHYLNVSQDKIKSKGMTSVKSRVTNLADIIPDLTVEDVKEAIIEAFIKEYSIDSQVPRIEVKTGHNWPEDEKFRSNVARNSSWAWCYGESPDFDICLKNRFSWGGIELYFKLDEGIITSAEVFSDSLYEEIISQLPKIFIGTRLIGSELSGKIRNGVKAIFDLAKDEDKIEIVMKDIAEWLDKEV